MTHIEYSGSKLVDERGNQVGQVSDVIYDGSDSTPSWLVVKTGLFRGEHLVPADGSYKTDSDAIVVPFPADVIKSSPKTGGDHVLNSDLRGRLARHYALEN
jgi:uncharacterized protein YrrD